MFLTGVDGGEERRRQKNERDRNIFHFKQIGLEDILLFNSSIVSRLGSSH